MCFSVNDIDLALRGTRTHTHKHRQKQPKYLQSLSWRRVTSSLYLSCALSQRAAATAAESAESKKFSLFIMTLVTFRERSKEREREREKNQNDFGQLPLGEVKVVFD